MLDRLPSHIIESALLQSIDVDYGEETRALARFGAVSRRMRDPARRASLHGARPTQGLRDLLVASPDLGRHIRTFIFDVESDAREVPSDVAKYTAEILRSARAARRLRVQAPLVILTPLVVLALGCRQWREVSVWPKRGSRLQAHVSLDIFKMCLRTWGEWAQTLEIYAMGLPLDDWDDAALMDDGALVGLPRLRTLVIQRISPGHIRPFMRIGLAITKFAFSTGADSEDDDPTFYDYGFSALPASVERIVAMNGGCFDVTMTDLPALKHIESGGTDVVACAEELVRSRRVLDLLRLVANSPDELAVLAGLMVIALHPLASQVDSAARPCRRLEIVKPVGYKEAHERFLIPLREACAARDVEFEVFIYGRVRHDVVDRN